MLFCCFAVLSGHERIQNVGDLRVIRVRLTAESGGGGGGDEVGPRALKPLLLL